MTIRKCKNCITGLPFWLLLTNKQAMLKILIYNLKIYLGSVLNRLIISSSFIYNWETSGKPVAEVTPQINSTDFSCLHKRVLVRHNALLLVYFLLVRNHNWIVNAGFDRSFIAFPILENKNIDLPDEGKVMHNDQFNLTNNDFKDDFTLI